jgi:hypothetical protein
MRKSQQGLNQGNQRAVQIKTNSIATENHRVIAFLSLPSEVVPLILVFIPAFLAILFTAIPEAGKGGECF